MRKLLLGNVSVHFRDRMSIFWALMFPLAFITVFGLFDLDEAQTTEIIVVDQSESALASAIVESVRALDLVSIEAITSDLDFALREHKDGAADVVVVLPRGLGSGASPVDLPVYYRERDSQQAQLVVQAMTQLTDELNLRAAGAERAVRLVAEPLEARNRTQFDFLLPGILTMGMMAYAVVGIAGTLAQYRTQRILRRVQASPLPVWKFVVAQSASFLVISLMQLVVILLTARIFFGSHAIEDIALTLPVALAGNVLFLNLGVVVGSVTRSVNAAQGMGNAITLPMMFLSGTFYPTDTLPALVEDVVQFLPLTPLVDLMRGVLLEGDPFWAQPEAWAIVGGWLVVSSLLAGRTFRLSD